MKKILAAMIAFLFLFISTAWALTVAWDEHADLDVLGYTIYWQEQGTTEEFRADVPGRTTTQYIIEDHFLKISTPQNPVIYDIWASAYNDQANSDSSEVITMERVYAFSPPSSNLPTVIIEPEKPTTVIITVTP